MHSLKNTIVAVGLLGLSFLFYQASSNKSPVNEDMIPALEISDGADVAMATDSDVLPPIEMPKIDAPQLLNESSLPGSGPGSSLGMSSEMPRSDGPPLDFSGTETPSEAKPLAESLSNEARDAGLIKALTDQSAGPESEPLSNNQFQSSPGDRLNLVKPPSTEADSSFNAQATGPLSSGNSAIMQVDSVQPTVNFSLQAVWPQVEDMVARKEFRKTLELLSSFYRTDNLNGPQRQRLMPWLDGLAGKVIFSTEHHLEGMPYTVANETLADIGERWNVPAELVHNINQDQISDPAQIPAGTKLKVVRGPFDAEIDLKSKVLTLFLGDLYAGRFPIRVGISGNPKPGEFRVMVKSESGHNWRDADGNDYPPEAPENGYGPYWIGLSGHLCIHAVDDSASEGHHGCFGLSEKDAKDVFSILTDKSNITIR